MDPRVNVALLAVVVVLLVLVLMQLYKVGYYRESLRVMAPERLYVREPLRVMAPERMADASLSPTDKKLANLARGQ